jgi:hypothetical protein
MKSSFLKTILGFHGRNEMKKSIGSYIPKGAVAEFGVKLNGAKYKKLKEVVNVL